MADLIFGLKKSFYNDFVKIFKKYPKIDKVLLYGSRAKGTEKPHSDFDLAILAPSMSDQEFALVWNELVNLPLIFKLDILHFERLTNEKLKDKILKEGISFYPHLS